jgi:hypothetical protein
MDKLSHGVNAVKRGFSVTFQILDSGFSIIRLFLFVIEYVCPRLVRKIYYETATLNEPQRAEVKA